MMCDVLVINTLGHVSSSLFCSGCKLLQRLLAHVHVLMFRYDSCLKQLCIFFIILLEQNRCAAELRWEAPAMSTAGLIWLASRI